MYYKYRSIGNMKFLLNILLNERLYAAKYSTLNDPMEGIYYYQSDLPDNVVNNIFNNKQRMGIVSLSGSYNNMLMWSHYSSGHKGVVIGVEVDESVYEVESMNYETDYLKIETREYLDTRKLAEKILRNKFLVWKYEDEKRIITYDSEFVKIRIKEVITGYRVCEQDHNLLKQLVEIINQNKRENDKIVFRKLREDELDFKK